MNTRLTLSITAAVLVAASLAGCSSKEVDYGQQLANCETFATTHHLTKGQTDAQVRDTCVRALVKEPNAFQTTNG